MPRHAPLDAIAESLATMRARGGFATRIVLPSEDLRLAVDGVGSIRLPVSAATARALVGVARPALYGLGERTLYDPRVRDTWTIAKSRVKPDRRTWGPRLTAVLERVRCDLGLSDACTLTAELHDLLVYARGQFFLPHQDSEKHDDMVGTLVVMLPSACSGGALSIAHHDERMVVRGSADKLTCVAFYADCRHEVQPVRSGVRVVLTYDLRLGHAREAAGAKIDERAVAELARRVEAHFGTPVPSWRPTETTEPPDRLVYLLDHEYTQRGLEWARLKNADAMRAAALREVARRLDCEVTLALADVHETWNCEFDGAPYDGWRRGRRRWDDDEEEPNVATETRPVDLVQAEVELRHVVGHDRGGTAARGGVDFDEEVCWTKPSDELKPFESAYEGYQGNYGNTLDRWYHRAAVVLWPRARAFAIAAKASPEWAVTTLRDMVAAGKKTEARAKARELLAFWPATVRAAESATALVPTLRLVCELGDRELAAALPRPFSRPALGPELATACVEVATKYGRATCTALLEAWATGPFAEERVDWIAGSQRFCERLATEEGGAGRAIAAAWLAAQWEWLAGGERTERDEPAHFRDDRLQRRAPAILALLGGAVLVDDATALAIVGWLAGRDDEAFPLRGIMAVCRKAFDAKRSNEPMRESLRPVLQRCVRELETRLSAPARAPGDWSIRWRARCKCELCAALAGFLARADVRRLDWPLAKDRRQHVHNTIDGHRLPVSHETRRSGSPYTLVLVKTEALFEREAKERTWCALEVVWVRERLGGAEAKQKKPRGRR